MTGRSLGRARRAAAVLALLILLITFGAAASFKVINYPTYVRGASALMPTFVPLSLGRVLLAALPGAEAGIVVLLLVRRWRRLGAALAGIAVIVFTALALSRYSGNQMLPSCGCTWPTLRVLAPEHLDELILRNGVLLAASVLCVASGRRASRVGGE